MTLPEWQRTVSESRIGKYQLLAELNRTESFVDWSALSSSGDEVRLKLFHPDVSSNKTFRARFRKDHADLSRLKHPHILSPSDWGENQGQFYSVTRAREGKPLSQRLSESPSLHRDEFMDLAWQLASAVQCLHNHGLTCGELSADTIIITDALKIFLAEVCVANWVAEAGRTQQQAPVLFAVRSTDDLRHCGTILTLLLSNVEAASTRNQQDAQTAEIRALIGRLQSHPQTLTARDVQRKLGSILLQLSGDSIEIRDHRKGHGSSTRSIVDELFDDEGLSRSDDYARDTGRSQISIRLLAVLFLIVALALCAAATKWLTN